MIPPDGNTIPPDGDAIPPDGIRIPPGSARIPPGVGIAEPSGESLPPAGKTPLTEGREAMPTSWIPRRESDRLVWLQNFALKLKVYVGTAGIVAADTTNVDGYLAAYLWIINRTDQIRTASQDITEFKSILSDGPIGTPIGAYPAAPVYPAAPAVAAIAGIFILIVQLAERIRNTLGYTTAIGEDLGIIPPVGVPALGDATFTATPLPNSEVRCDWVKAGSDGVTVDGQRAGETTWTNLGTDRFAPFVDTRPPLVAGQPEVRRYRMRYLDGDDPVGNYSATVSVVTIP